VSVPTPVVGDDRELVAEDLSDRLENAAGAGRAHDQQHGRTAAADLVVELGAIDSDSRHQLPSVP
jgi:hypothetical protein